MELPRFKSFFTEFETFLLTDGFNTITRCGLWEWLKTVKETEEFYFTEGPEMDRIREEVMATEYTVQSFAWMMRQMRRVAVLGTAGYNKTHDELNGHPCPCRHEKGYKDGWCGVAGGGVPACDH